jgi:predicted PurR-regulated permease PerM
MKFKWDKKYLFWGVTAFLVIVCSILFFALVNRFNDFTQLFKTILRVLSPFIYGFLIAYLLNGPMGFFEKRVFAAPAKRIAKGDARREFKFRRQMAIVVTHLLAMAIVVGLLILVLPQLYFSMEGLVTALPDYAEAAIKWVNELPAGNKEIEAMITDTIGSISEFLTNWINQSVLPQMDNILASVTGGIINVVKAVANVVMGVVASFYIMYHKELFRAQAKRCLYSLFKPLTANRIMEEAGFIKKAFGDFLVGNALDSLIIGILNYIFMLIAGMPYSALISVIVGVTNMLPIFGPIIGGVPCVLLLLLVDPMQGLVFGIFTLVLQTMDSQVIKPKVLGGVSGLSGFWIMFAILVFGGFFGLWGMLLGVPILSVLYNAIGRFHRRRLLRRGLPAETENYEDVDIINPATNTPIYRPGCGPMRKAEENDTEYVEEPLQDDTAETQIYTDVPEQELPDELAEKPAGGSEHGA